MAYISTSFQLVGGHPPNTAPKLKIEYSLDSNFNTIAGTLLLPFNNGNPTDPSNLRYFFYHNLTGLDNDRLYHFRLRLEFVDSNDIPILSGPWVVKSYLTPLKYPQYVSGYIADQDLDYQTSKFGHGARALSMSNDANEILINTLSNSIYTGYVLKNLSNLALVNSGFYTGTLAVKETANNLSPLGFTSLASRDGKHYWTVFQDGVSNDLAYINRYNYSYTLESLLTNTSYLVVLGESNSSHQYGPFVTLCTNLNATILCVKQNSLTHLYPSGKSHVLAVFLATDSNDNITNEVRQILDPDIVEPNLASLNVDDFGTAMALSQDGSRLVIAYKSTQRADTGHGTVYVFARSGNSYVLEQVLQAINTDSYFGHAVTINDDGTIIAVSEFKNDDSSTNGRVSIFKRSGVTWSQTELILPPYRNDPALLDDTGFGYAIKLNGSGHILAITAPYVQRYTSGYNKTTERVGAIFVYTSDGGTYSYVQVLHDNIDIDGAELGTCIDMTQSGSVILATSPKTNVDPLTFINAQTSPNVVIFT